MSARCAPPYQHSPSPRTSTMSARAAPPAARTLILVAAAALGVAAMGDTMIGPGLWRVLHAEQCAGAWPLALRVQRRRVNRSHDGFDVRIAADAPVDRSYGVRVDVCKYVDGGCKPYQVLADDSLPAFVDKFAADNRRKFFEEAGLDPPDFPFPEGEHEVKNFVFNYWELPEESIFGAFCATCYLLRDGTEHACARVDLEFVERDDER